MAQPRPLLDALLREIAGTNVYFQPPETIKMKYPAIVYQRDAGDTKFADDKPYLHTIRYQVTVIDQSPDSALRPLVAALPMCTFSRFFVADNLNHDVFTIYS